MPESVTDRCTKSHESIFLLAKSARYYFDAEAIKEQSVSDHLAGNRTHKGATAYLNGATEHRTEQGLVAYAKRTRDSWHGSQFHDGKNLINHPNVGKNRTNGKWADEDDQSSGHRIVENVAAARANGADHDRPFGETRNKRSVWTVPTAPYTEAHFATFPPDLIKPCILAGTSARGCCPKCGAPWERIVEENLVPTPKACRTFVIDQRDKNADSNDQGSNRAKDGHKAGWIRADKTLGWRATCSCGIENIVPCTVLDPFLGSGTTAQVALELGRSCIGIELNPQYATLARRRTAVTPGLQLA